MAVKVRDRRRAVVMLEEPDSDLAILLRAAIRAGA